MEEKVQNAISTFDSLFTTNHIQMMKVLLPHLAPAQQNGFAIYIKFMELQYTFHFLHQHPHSFFSNKTNLLSSDFLNSDNEDTLELLDELLYFSGPEERTRIENMKNMMQNMKQMREMMDMLQMMQDMFPEGMGNANPMDLFSGLSGVSGFSDASGMSDMPKMSDLFSMFGNNGE